MDDGADRALEVPPTGSPSESARAQLQAIAEVGADLERAGLDHWLFGGWAVDLWCGRVTRQHHDVDLAVLLADRPAVHGLLVACGWAHEPQAGEVVGTRYRRDGVLLELTFVIHDGERVLLPFEPEPAVWSERSFGSARRSLHGTSARVIALDVLLRDKNSPRDDPDDGEKDRSDLAALERATRQQ
ncbi:hypothetical protein UB45_10100 [Terrabacter sp. 28]|nr:hypothetical protein UB45_10100 [Terrabacter sp. 28]